MQGWPRPLSDWSSQAPRAGREALKCTACLVSARHLPLPGVITTLGRCRAWTGEHHCKPIVRLLWVLPPNRGILGARRALRECVLCFGGVWTKRPCVAGSLSVGGTWQGWLLRLSDDPLLCPTASGAVLAWKLSMAWPNPSCV